MDELDLAGGMVRAMKGIVCTEGWKHEVLRQISRTASKSAWF